MVLDDSVSGAADVPLALMLHGFCVSRKFGHNQMLGLAAAHYFAMAPNHRGYSVDARLRA